MTQENKIYSDLAERYIAAWNETNADRRRDLIAKTWTESATYVDPLMKGFGDHLRFSWALAADGEPALVKGTDFGRVVDGHLHSITGFIDQMPATQQ